MLPPNIDTRDWNSLLERMTQLAPYYTPEWRFTPEQPDSGTSLFMIVADMLQENIRRLNQVPLNQFIAYLNLFNVSLLSAKPANAFLTFTTNEGAPNPVLIPARTQAAAPGGEEHLLFETERPLLVTPARPMHVICTDGGLDQILHVTDRLHDICMEGSMDTFAAFPGPAAGNLQEHCLYIGQEDVFHIVRPAIVELELSNDSRRFALDETCKRLSASDLVKWEYSSGKGWLPFEKVTLSDNRIILQKRTMEEIVPLEMNGIESRWIRASVEAGLIDRLSQGGSLPEIDGVAMRSAFAGDLQDGITPDTLFHDDVEVKAGGLYPFGEFFVPQACFYLSCREAFSKKGGLVTMQFRMKTVPNRMSQPKPPEIDWKLIMKKNEFDEPEIPNVSIMKTVWEYWNGKGWVRLFTGEEYEQLFYKPFEEEFMVVFHCPEDIEETPVNSHMNYWIRCRVMKIENMYSADPIYLSPWIENIRFRYEYGDKLIQAHHCQTCNHLQWSNRRGLVVSSQRTAFHPFEPLECRQAVMYLGFDSPPVKGPIGMYISIEPAGDPPEIRDIRWEYFRKKPGMTEWAELKVDDDTGNLRRSGTVQFVGPSDFAIQQRYGVNCFWIRAVLLEQSSDSPSPLIKGIYMNTVSSVQQETIRNEIPENMNTSMHQFRLSRPPVRLEEVWVDETGQLTDEQIRTLLKQIPDDMDIIRDSEGHVQKVWVKWQAVDSWSGSGADDRHYIINHNSGVISFGDGAVGRLPVPFDAEKLKVHYKRVRGAEGNVPARSINVLQNSFAFINTVFNPEPSAGGSDSETLEEALERGPQLIKHRGRAVTAEDFEWLAREASLQVAKARCLPNTNARLGKENGTVAIVVLPKGGTSDPFLFQEVKKQVEQYLSNRAPNAMTRSGRIHVISPAYLQVSVQAHLIVRSMDVILSTEQEVLSRLNRFLDPLKGNYDNKGWGIGQPIHISNFYALLKSIPAVHHIANVTMDIVKVDNGVRVEIPASQSGHIVHGIITNGTHQISMSTS